MSAERITDEERGSVHADISPERDYPPPRSPAAGPWPGSATSWRNTPQSTVTFQILGAVLLLCLGLLLGTSLTVSTLEPKLRRQAEERRKLNEEWAAVRTARRQRSECPRCANPLSERDWYVAPMIPSDRPDD